MKTRPLFVLIILLTLAGCNSAEIARLQIENDSLRNELDFQNMTARSLEPVTIWLDSIDANRNLLGAHLKEGMGYKEFSTRLKDINEFVTLSEQKLGMVQEALKSSKRESSGYLILLDALKTEVQLRVDDIVKLNEQVMLYKGQNEGLRDVIKMREDAVHETSRRALSQEQELLLLEAKIQAMENNFKATEANAYYARARAVEEAARRTRLAPQKKRETYREALELYKKSLSLGKHEAKTDIAELRKRIE